MRAEYLLGKKKVRASGRDEYLADLPRVRAIVGKVARFRAWCPTVDGDSAGAGGAASLPLPTLDSLGSLGGGNSQQGALDPLPMPWDAGLSGASSQGADRDAAFGAPGGQQYQQGSLGGHVGGMSEQAAAGGSRVPAAFCNLLGRPGEMIARHFARGADR